MPQTHLAEFRRAVLARVLEAVDGGDPLVVLKAPPGSGKTHVATRAVALSSHRRRRVAVATGTNAQANDFCARMARDFPRIPVRRFASPKEPARDLGRSVAWIRKGVELPAGPAVVVATASKWAATDEFDPFDVLLVDEAWQLPFAEFMLLSRVAPRFVLVGDPGQIPPVVPIDVARWQTCRRPPHAPAPEALLGDASLGVEPLALPVTTRLPHDSAAPVRAFYDFPFEAWAAPGERRLVVAPSGARRGVDAAIDRLRGGSMALLTLPTPDAGPPLEDDPELARAAADLVRRFLARGAASLAVDEGELAPSPLAPEDIGIAATHRIAVSRLREALGDLAGRVRVDTPERWQGLERRVMIAVHPLSGVLEPASFDLSTGRLCVMASRHRIGLVVLARDHVGRTLEDHLPVAEQSVGARDEAGRGHAQHLAFWSWLHAEGRAVEA